MGTKQHASAAARYARMIEGIRKYAAQIENAIITAAKIQDAAITTAKIEDAAITTAKISGNATFFGNLDVKSATSGERMEITNDRIRVYDAAGTLRVVLGDLS